MLKQFFVGFGFGCVGAISACNAGQVLPYTSKATSSPNAAASCKRGVAYNNMSSTDWRALSPNVAWFYSWSAQAEPQAIAADAEAMRHFIPMVWGQNQLAATTPQSLPQSSFVLGFNEPNFDSQAHLTPDQAAKLWPALESLAKAQNMNIIAPAVNYCSGACSKTSPFDWLDAFLAACTNCRIDAIGVHVYMCTPADVQNYLKQFESRYHKPLWVSEFACLDTPNPTAEQQLAYINAVVPIFEADPMVQRYAWFTGRYPEQPAVDLLGESGALTPLGQAYVNLPRNCAAP